MEEAVVKHRMICRNNSACSKLMYNKRRVNMRKEIIFGGVLGGATLLGMPGQAKAEKPNVLLIMVDDLGYADLGCQGVRDFKTPNIDKLAASGIRFTDGYVTAPQCGPSRAGLMTGMSQARFGCMDNKIDNGLPGKDVVQILPEQMNSAGYRTGLIGKWHVGFEESEQHGHGTIPGNHPWERGFDYTLKHHGGMAHFYPYREDGIEWMNYRKREHRYQQKLPHKSEPAYVEDVPADSYMTDYFTTKASEFITRNSKKTWFLFLSYNAPHTPCVATEEKLKNYSHLKDPMRRTLAAMMESLDDGVGEVLKTLDETGQRENTLVWFLSDNGGPTHHNGSRNEPLSGKKGDLFEGGIRVPFMVSWPGKIKAKQVVNDPVISLDILPTSLAVAGVDKVADIHEGNNLLPWLLGKEECPNEELFWAWRSCAAVRYGTLKETRNEYEVVSPSGEQLPRNTFSDLAVNLQEVPSKGLKSPEKQSFLANKLNKWLKKLNEDQKVLTP